MTLLLHISDTHFGTEQASVVAALCALARTRCPGVLVLSGDVTQRARAPEFAAARAFCDRLAISPMLALPGNHDVPLYNVLARLWQPYAGYKAAFGSTLEPVVQTDDLLVIGVNTTRWHRHKHGEVSPTQVERVSKQLQEARPGQLRVVVTHQPAAVSRPEDEHDRLRGAEPALQAWAQAGADLVLGGHIHLPFVLDLHARQLPTPRRMWVVQAGTAVSSRIRHGTCNSVNLIEWHPALPGAARSCTVERCDYSAASGRFETASVTTLALD